MAANTHKIKIAFPNAIMIRLINIATEVNGGSISAYIRDTVYADLMKRSILTKEEYEIMKDLDA